MLKDLITPVIAKQPSDLDVSQMVNMGKKVLLVNPQKHSWSKLDDTYKFPIGLLFLAESLKPYGIEVSYLDLNKQSINDIEYHDYLLVGITMLTGDMIKVGLEVAQKIKDYQEDIPIVIGGVHPTLLPAQSLRHKLVDFVVIGEGENVIKELSLALFHNNREAFKTMKGLAYKEKGEIFVNSERASLVEMDSLPMHLDYDKTINIPHSEILSMPVHTSRGCPFRCGFCYNVEVNKRNYRVKTPERVVDEILHLKSIFPNFVSIDFQTEDEFFIYPKRVKKILELLAEKNIKVNWSSFIHFRTLSRVDEEMLELMKRSVPSKNISSNNLKSGLLEDDSDMLLNKHTRKHPSNSLKINELKSGLTLSLGGESGSQRILDEIIVKDGSIEQMKQGVEKLNKAKIYHVVSFMSAVPTETIDDLRKTINLIKELYSKYPYFNINHIFVYNPIPGTSIYDMCVNKYGFKPPQDLESWGEWEMSLTSTKNFTWHTQEYFALCQDIYKWTYHTPFLYFRKFEDCRQYKPSLGYPMYLFISTIQRFRCKKLFFKYPIEFKLLEKSLTINYRYKTLFSLIKDRKFEEILTRLNRVILRTKTS